MKFAALSALGISLVVCGILLALLIYLYVRKHSGSSLVEVLCRVGAGLALALVIGQPYLEQIEERSSALVLVDISDSMDEAVGQQLLERAEGYRANGFDLSYFPFAGNSGAVVLSSSEQASFRRIKESWGGLDVGHTNFERLALSHLSGRSGPVLLLSDGQENQGSFTPRIQSLAAQGIKFYPLVPVRQEEQHGTFRISHLWAPLVATSQKSVDVRVSLQNTTAKKLRGTLELKHDQKLLAKEVLEVEAGQEIVNIQQSDPAKEGIKEITAVFVPEDPSYSPSTETIYLSGQQRERVLVLNGSAEDARFISEALTNQSYQVTSLTADERLNGVPKLSDFSAILFNNISVNQLPRGMPSEIEHYVRSGGGFAMIGGNRSFGLGGYIGTPIESILPVRLLPPQTIKKRLNVAVQLIIDKSQSMQFDEKLEFAKEAAREVVRNLKDDDYAGVIGFDSAPFVLVKIGQIAQIRAFALERIGMLYPAKKTNLLPAMEEGRRGLMGVDAGRKHMIVLTDGKLPDADSHGNFYTELVRQLRLVGMTVSTVLVGSDIEAGLLKEMAELGGGAFYQTNDPKSLPRIFLNDIRVSTGERTLQENQDYPVREGPDRLLSTTIRSFPPLRGYVQTQRREGAALELVLNAGDKAEPLLASWKVDQGRALAFTSDANGRWSGFWVRWPRFQPFWSDIVDAVRPKSTAGESNLRFDLRHSVERGVLMLDLSIFSSEISGSVGAEIKMPDRTYRNISFSASAPGRYQASLENITAGTYEVRASIGGMKLTPVSFGLSGELFGERKGQGFNLPFLERLASGTGGMLNPPPERIRGDKVQALSRVDLSRWFLLLAALLLIFEVLWREVWGRRFAVMRRPINVWLPLQ